MSVLRLSAPSQRRKAWYNGPFGPRPRGAALVVLGSLAGERKDGEKQEKGGKRLPGLQRDGDYDYTIRRKPGGEKLTLKKYSPRLRKHTEHTEKKK